MLDADSQAVTQERVIYEKHSFGLGDRCEYDYVS